MDSQIKSKIEELESRISYQEKFHEGMTPEGNLKHTVSVLPLLIISTAMGMFLGYNFYKLLKK